MSEHIDDASVTAEKHSVKGGKMPAIGSQIGARTSSGLTPQSRNKRPHQKGGREEEPRSPKFVQKSGEKRQKTSNVAWKRFGHGREDAEKPQ